MAYNKLSAAALATLIQKTITAAATTNVTGATNANPIVITSTAHGLATGQFALIAAVGGNTNANGVAQVTVVDANTFSIAVAGNANFTSGGTVAGLTISQWCGDLTQDQLSQLQDACARLNVGNPATKTMAQIFTAGLVF